MGHFEVDPHELRRGADALEPAVPAAAVSEATADAGHARLTSAIALLGTATRLSWSRLQVSTATVVDQLRSTAALFENADADGERAAHDLQTR